jgi:hypothetical protein
LADIKLKVCADKNCSNEFKQYNSLQKYCGSVCMNKNRKPNLKLKSLYKIPKVSDKRKALIPIYEKVRIEVLAEAKFICFIDGCKNVANTIEHTAGRKGFYDDWARDNNISLLVDKRFLKACCLFHNGELESNPELSKQYQLSKIHGGKKN